MIHKKNLHTEGWVKIGPIPGILYAEMIGEVLKDKNIPYSISQDGIATAYLLSGTNITGNEAFIFVPEEFEQATLEIVEQIIDNK